MKTKLDIASAIGRWTKNQFNFRASFYTGRGVNNGDLNSMMLEKIYQGLRVEVSQEVATNFAKFVDKLKDLSASAFIQAFEQFWEGGCQDTNFQQRTGTSNEITGHGHVRDFEAIALLGAALGGQRMNVEETERQSRFLKSTFIEIHRDEIKK